MKDNLEYFQFGEFVAKLRLSIGLSQRDASTKGDMDATRWSALEKGRVIAPGQDVVDRVARGLGVEGRQQIELHAIAARDRVMREAIRHLPVNSHGLFNACLDASHSLAEEDLRKLESGLRQMIIARSRLKSFLNEV